MSEVKEIYFNEKQLAFINAPQKVKTAICGRGFGKSTMFAGIILNMARELPRAKGVFVALTLTQIKDDIFPAVLKKLNEFGLVENTHYVYCKRPPEHFDAPYSNVDSYEDVFTMFNGFTIVFKSAIRGTSKRGASWDFAFVDEAATVKKQFFEAVLTPSIRGNLYKWKSLLHHSIVITTSRPRTGDGRWVLKYKEIAELEPSRYYFMEASSFDNADVLGEDWFNIQKATLSPSDYVAEIENKELSQVQGGFYRTFDRQKHSTRIAYMRDSELLDISFDFGGKFSCCTVWQEQGGKEICLNEFFVKGNRKITDLVQDVCDFYYHKGYKYVRIWGEPRGMDRNPIEKDMYQIIQREFERRKWMVTVMVKGGYKTRSHKDRYIFFEQLLSGERYDLPQIVIHQDFAANTIISIETADVLPDMQKDKGKEKDENYPQELATHLSDTVDYYLFEKYAIAKTQRRGAAGVR